MEVLNIKDFYAEHNYMYMAIIELTTMCNYNCKHCFIDQHSGIGMPTDEIFKVLDELRGFGVYEIQFTGGEIFTRRDAMDIIRYARNLKFKVILLTNLSLVTDEMMDELDNLHVETISTTLFSMRDEVNDRITLGRQTATKALDRIKRLNKTGIRCEIKTVVMKDNSEDFRDIDAFCKDNGIHYVATEGLFPKVSGNTAPRDLMMTYNQLCSNISCLDHIRFGGDFEQKKSENDPVCCELHYGLFIDSKGNVYPCNLWFRRIANIKEKTISEIWNDPFLTRIRLTKWKDLPKCSSCNQKEYCVRCTGIVEAIQGNYLMEDPFACRTASARKRLHEQKATVM